MRSLALVALAGLIGGCASQPADTSAGAPGLRAAPNISDPIQQRAAIDAALRTGYRERIRDKQPVYCREETPIGTRFSELHCYSVQQLTDMARNKDEMHDALARPLVCTGGAQCVAQ